MSWSLCQRSHLVCLLWCVFNWRGRQECFVRRRHCSIPISPCDQLSCRGNPPSQVLSVESLAKFLFGEGEAWMRCDASCRLNADPEPCLHHAHLQMFRPLGVRHDNTSGRVIHLLILTSVRSRSRYNEGALLHSV